METPADPKALRELLKELNWGKEKAAFELDKARQRGIPFDEWVQTAVSIDRKTSGCRIKS